MNLFKKSRWGLGIAFLILFLLGSLYDLQISESLYDRANLIAGFLWQNSEIPVSGLALSAIALIANTKLAVDPQKPVNLTGFRIIGILTSVAMGFQVSSYRESGSILWSLAFLAFYLAMDYGMRYLSEERTQQLLPLAWAIIFVYAGAVLVPNLLKVLWGRPRYRIVVSGEAGFVPWYSPLGINWLNDDYKSFPSGHSAIAAVSLLSTSFPRFFSSLKGKERYILFLSIAWTLAVMVSRIILGDHYLSDTLAGLAITLILIGVAKRVFLKPEVTHSHLSQKT